MKNTMTDAEVLRRMGPVSTPGRGRVSADTKRLVAAGLVRLEWISMKYYVLQRTPKGEKIAQAFERAEYLGGACIARLTGSDASDASVASAIFCAVQAARAAFRAVPELRG